MSFIKVGISLISGLSCALTSMAADSYQDQLMLELITASPGTVIEIPEGTFQFDQQLSLAVDGVTIRGKGMNRSILSFSGQQLGAEGLLVTSNGVTLEGFTIEDTKGDAIKINRADGVVLRGVQARWTQGPATENGAYGLYPVQSRNILIEGSVVSGASDAGIYVGQSRNVIIRQNQALYNVAGIEVENSVHVDVYDNFVTKNTGGVLVFNLPDLSMYGERTRVYGNTIVENNTPNFSPPSNTVADVPAGTGVMVTANKKVEIFNNFIADHKTSNIILASYAVTGRPINDPNYDPYVESLYLHDNTMLRGGFDPQGGASEASQGLFQLLRELIGVPFPSILYDGSFNPERRNQDGTIPANLKICIVDNFNASFIDLNLSDDMQNISTDLTPHHCTLDRDRPVVLPDQMG